MTRFLYNLLFPIVFMLYLPGLVVKYIRRGGAKDGYGERFGIFSSEKRKRLSELRSPVWMHAVSVGETVVAVSMLKKWLEKSPGKEFVLSTTTTTGQAIARAHAPEGVSVIFCPIDFFLFTNRALRLVDPSLLLIFETELWPNLIRGAVNGGAEVALVNARMSDRSSRGYKRFSMFTAPILRGLSLVCAQSGLDAERFKAVEPSLEPVVTGNMKFDQAPEKDAAEFPDLGLDAVFGTSRRTVVLAASTHPGEEKLVAEIFARLRKRRPELKLVIVPRHAERGGEVASDLATTGLRVARRSVGDDAGGGADILLADTTGEMLAFINASDIVVMGKSFAGHDEGHNVIEPAALGKPVVTGRVARNFRQVLEIMTRENAVMAVDGGVGLEESLNELLDDPEKRVALGERAKTAVEKARGATDRTIELCEKLLS